MSETIVLGGGCFWCLEASLQQIKGVENVIPGYSGGSTENPSYYKLADHAEVVQVTFDSQVIKLQDILDIFWAIHDPTTLNKQGNDIGSQYRSVILYASEEQKLVAETSRDEVQKLWKNPVVTEIKPLQKFYEAEAEHHNYFLNHPEAAYCQVVINPKLEKLRAKFANRLK